MSPPAVDDAANDRSVAAAMRADLWKGALVALLAMPVAFAVLRVAAWPWLLDSLMTVEATVVAVTPFDVLAVQAQVALVVGLLLGGETLLYGARDALLPERWRGPLPQEVQSAFAVVAVALFPIGAVLGYQYAFPALVDSSSDATWSIVQWTRLVFAVAIPSGLATQAAFVVAVGALARLRPADAQ